MTFPSFAPRMLARALFAAALIPAFGMTFQAAPRLPEHPQGDAAQGDREPVAQEAAAETAVAQ